MLEGEGVGTFPGEKQHDAGHASLRLSALVFTLGWREVELERRSMDLRQKTMKGLQPDVAGGVTSQTAGVPTAS